MPELRKDPIIGRWVIVATERAKRPSDFRYQVEYEKPEDCHLCEGHEDKTPPEIMAIRKDGTKANEPGWEARIIPSGSGFLKPEGDNCQDLRKARQAAIV